MLKGFGNPYGPKTASTSLLFKFVASKTPRALCAQGILSEFGSDSRNTRGQVITDCTGPACLSGVVALLLLCWINPETSAIKPSLEKVICGEILSLQ